MAGTATEAAPRTITNAGVKKLTWDWTSDASGDVSAAASASSYTGHIMRVTFVPSGTAPTDLYDVTLLDEDSVDLLGGEGANRSATEKQQVQCALGNTYGYCWVDGTISLVVSNAGNAKQGQVNVYILEEKNA